MKKFPNVSSVVAINRLRGMASASAGLALSGLMLMIIFLFCCSLPLPAQAVTQETLAENSFRLESTLNEFLGEQEAALYQDILPPDESISWQVYLPRGNPEKPPGVFVYISPHRLGRIDSRWPAVMDEHNLIYIGANDSGNDKSTNLRVVLANLGVRMLAKRYPIDGERIYISGFSGGGRVASMAATQYPEAFSGAIYICGVNYWIKGDPQKLERVLNNRFVFLTGTNDFNFEETRRVYRRYLAAGAQHSKLMVIKRLGHKHPGAADLNEALLFLRDVPEE
jgi:predicted esterase